MKQNASLFDSNTPPKLKKTQLWFASIITSPIDEDNRMNPLSPSGDSIEEEAFDYIIPSPTLRPAQRIQLYNQQYWWRLFTVMHDAAPLVTRLFGYRDFNQLIAKPYLLKYPPNTWSLNEIGNLLPKWIEENYHAKDKQLVLDSALMDTALNIGFYAKRMKVVDSQAIAMGMEKLLTQTLRLQPYVSLLEFRYDLDSFRKEMIKEDVEYWMNHDFPKLLQDRQHYFVIYRNIHNQLNCEEISSSAYRLLNFFSEGSTINEACEWLEEQDETLYNEANKNLHIWFQEWIFRQWLYIDEQP